MESYISNHLDFLYQSMLITPSNQGKLNLFLFNPTFLNRPSGKYVISICVRVKLSGSDPLGNNSRTLLPPASL